MCVVQVWMNRAFFNGTGLGWGGSLCALVNYSQQSHRPHPDDPSRPIAKLAEDRMRHQVHHLAPPVPPARPPLSLSF